MVETVIFAVLKTSTIISAVTLLLIVLRPFILKKRTAKWLYFLFFVLFVRLILPFDFTLPEGGLVINIPEVIVGEVEKPSSEELSPEPESPVVESPSVSEPMVPEPSGDNFSSDENSNIHDSDLNEPVAPSDTGYSDTSEPKEPIFSETTEEPSVNLEISLYEIIGTVYFSGFVIFVLYQVVCYFVMLGSLKRNSVPCENPMVLETAEAIRKELCIKRKIPVNVCSAVSTPTLAGLIRPVLLFPENCDDPNYLGYIFRHEYMHYKHGDLYFKLLALAANAVHWFNPVIYLLRKESEKVVEFVCDSRVVEKCDGKFRSEYCNAIVDEVERSVLGKKHSSYMTTSFTGNKKTLKERLSSILDTSKKRKGVISFSVIVLLIVIAGVVVSCNVVDSENEKLPVDDTNISENVPPDPVIENKESGEDTDQNINNDVKVAEPIPENVVIKPEVTYTAFDSENYTPHLDTGNGELINELYSYILKPFRSEFMELVYQDEKLTVDTLDDYIIQMTVFAVFGVEGLEIRTETSSFGDEREYMIYPASLMEERAKIIYGDDVTIDHFTFYPMDYHTAEYVPDGEYYRLPSEPFSWESQNWGDQMNFSEFIRYEEDGEYIYIYDRFYTTEENGWNYGNIYACSAGEYLIAEKLEQGNYRYKDPETGEIVVAKGFGGAVIPEYKHTFMKDENGEYHWVSSEPVTDISSIEIELGSEFTDPDDILAEKLYGYLMKYDYYDKELVYQSGIMTHSAVSNYIKINTVFDVFGLGGLDREMSGALLQDSYRARVNIIYPAELMEERVRQILGPEATVVHGDAPWRDGVIVNYSEEDKCYRISAFDGGGDSPNCNYIYYIRHENRGDEFVIYDKYVYMTEANGIYKYYRATAQQDFITQSTSKNPAKYATVYKHTFKKAADGSYYWFSTEQATADNGISEEVGLTYVLSDSGTVEGLGRKLFEDYASGNSLAGAEYYATVDLKETFVDSADLVVFYLEKSDDFAALYFKENNGEYQFLRTDNDVTYRHETSAAFDLYGRDLFENYNLNRGTDLIKYQYAAAKLVYQAGALESEGILYVDSNAFYNIGTIPNANSNIIWSYSSGFLVMPKQEPLDSIFADVEIEFETSTDFSKELIFTVANGDKYRADIRESYTYIDRFYDDFEHMSDDFSDPQENLLFVKELYERFGEKIDYYAYLDIKGPYTFKAITKEVRYLDYEDYYLYFAADDPENCFYEYAYVYFRKYNGGVYIQGGSSDLSLNVGDAYIYSKDEVDAVLGDIWSEESAPEIIEPTPIESVAPVPVEPVAPEPVPVPVEPAPPAEVPDTPEVVSQPDEVLAEKLYQYIVKHDDSLNHELVYREGVTYESDLSDHLKSYTVYAVFGLFGKELPRVGQYEEDSKLTAQGYSWAYDEFEYELFYRRIFGPDAEINHADFQWGHSLYGIYSTEDKCYYITRQGGGDDWKLNYTYYIGCKNNGDEFIIYDKYVYVDSIEAPYGLYRASNGKGFITQINDKNFEQYATVYKHTFKKTSSGSYYWYSTEMATSENGISNEINQ